VLLSLFESSDQVCFHGKLLAAQPHQGRIAGEAEQAGEAHERGRVHLGQACRLADAAECGAFGVVQ
jgi:hypothetical protein